MSGIDRVPCIECRETWVKYQKKPPCNQCFPGIHLYNQTIWDLYELVGDQYIMGPNGPVSLNLVAVKTGLDVLDIDLRYRAQAIRTIKNFSSLIMRVQK